MAYSEIPENIALKTGPCLFTGKGKTISKCQESTQAKLHAERRIAWERESVPHINTSIAAIFHSEGELSFTLVLVVN
jgi:hypothetical protein